MDRVYLTQNNYNSFRSQAAILVVNTDVVINDAVVTFFDGCIFEYAGGIIRKASNLNSVTFKGNVQVENCGLNQMFEQIFVPDLINNEVPIEWFGGKCYPNESILWHSPSFSDNALATAVVANRSRKIKFQGGYYFFTQTVTIVHTGIILSGTMSFNDAGIYAPGNLDIDDDPNRIDVVSTLTFLSNTASAFIRATQNGLRLENLLFHEAFSETQSRLNTAVELVDDANRIFIDRCMFYYWGEGIYKNGTTSSGEGDSLTRCIINESCFSYIRLAAIDVKVHSITYNIIRDSWFHWCGCPISLHSSTILEDNSIENCCMDNTEYDSDVYDYYGCCAIYLRTEDTDQLYATNNISRCYIEHVGICPPGAIIAGDANMDIAAIISLGTSITLDNNFFIDVPKHFIIDDNSSITINDNGIAINYPITQYPLDYDFLIEVKSATQYKGIHQSILYNNSIPVPPNPNNSFVTKLVKFNENTKSHFSVINSYETRFTDYGPQIIKAENSRSVSTIASVSSENVIQVDYNPEKYTGIGYNYHSFRLYIYLTYTVYCDIYEVTIDMNSLEGGARLRTDNIRSIYGDTGILPSYDIDIKTKADMSGNIFYIYVNTPQMNPTFKVIITSDDIRVSDATAKVDFNSLQSTAKTINVHKPRGLNNSRPSFNALQNAESKGYEFYDTANNRKSVWNGSRWMAYKTEPDGILVSGTTGQRPTLQLTAADAGFSYFDTTLGKPVYWNGSTWVNANGIIS